LKILEILKNFKRTTNFETYPFLVNNFFLIFYEKMLSYQQEISMTYIQSTLETQMPFAP
jgi:hypothetical protein